LLGDELPYNLKSAANLAVVLIQRRKHADAERILREIVPRMRRAIGEEHQIGRAHV
jgi:hypothetical protein